MQHDIESICFRNDMVAPFLEMLGSIFKAMDQEYTAIASQYGFVCRGCDNNCCLTRFYHHTLLEYLFVYQGFKSLADEEQKAVMRRAIKVVGQYQTADQTDQKIRVPCPLHVNGLCSLYVYRPMICRLHGIPHELRHPLKGVLQGPGCDQFVEKNTAQNYYPFDRTPFYTEISMLEKQLRNILGRKYKIRMTVADMLVTF